MNIHTFAKKETDYKRKRAVADNELEDEITARPITIRFKTDDGMPSLKPKIEEVRLSTLNTVTAKSLQKEDPFMYHSIPGIRQARMLDREIDYDQVEALRYGYRDRRVLNHGSRRHDQAEEAEDAVIKRQTRFSTECDVISSMSDNMFIGDLFGNEN